MIDHDRLGEYLNDHLTGATTIVELLTRRQQQDPDPRIAGLLEEIRAERASLVALLEDLGQTPNPAKQVAGWVAEKATDVKRQVERLRDAPMAAMLEMELVQVGISGKQALWVMLGELVDHDDRIAALPLSELTARAQAQIGVVEQLRLAVGRRTLLADT